MNFNFIFKHNSLLHYTTNKSGLVTSFKLRKDIWIHPVIAPYRAACGCIPMYRECGDFLGYLHGVSASFQSLSRSDLYSAFVDNKLYGVSYGMVYHNGVLKTRLFELERYPPLQCIEDAFIIGMSKCLECTDSRGQNIGNMYQCPRCGRSVG